jgi:hypothetical protein
MLLLSFSAIAPHVVVVVRPALRLSERVMAVRSLSPKQIRLGWPLSFAQRLYQITPR